MALGGRDGDFADLERIRPEEWPWLRALERAFDGDGRFTLLNRPGRYAPRRVFQDRLRALGLQDFRTAPASAPPADLRFPVFLRWEDDHQGPWGGLLAEGTALEAAVAAARRTDPDRFPRLLVVEHLDCRDADGLVRKYGVVKAGAALVPRHVQFSAHWVVKRVDVVTDATVAEEEAWFAALPHAAALEAAFRALEGGAPGPSHPLRGWGRQAVLAWHRRGLAFPARP